MAAAARPVALGGLPAKLMLNSVGASSTSDCVPSSGNSVISTGTATTANCIVSLGPDQTVNALGSSRTVTFTCGAGASTYTLPGPNAQPESGCFDVQATVLNATTGAAIGFDQVTCAGASNGSSGDCSTVQNPICASGYLNSESTGACQPCLPGFSYVASAGHCTSPALSNNQCPPNSTPVYNSTNQTITSCIMPVLDSTPRSGNEVQLTVSVAAPDVVAVTVTGYTGSMNGSCPSGTEPESVTTPDGPATGCSFSLTVQENYVEVTKVSVIKQGDCGGSFLPSDAATAGASSCFALIKVVGLLVVKFGVDCSQEPNGTPAPNPPFHGDPVTDIVPTYDCSNQTLRIVNIPVPGVSVQLSATNAVFPTNCYPQALAPKPAPSPTTTATPTDTPTPTPTPTPDIAATPTATPTPPPVSGFENPAWCPTLSGSQTQTVQTDQYGLIGYNGGKITVAASTSTPSSTSIDISAAFTLDHAWLSGIPVWATLHFASEDTTVTCGTTNAVGTTSCTTGTDSSQLGDLVPIDVSGVYRCEEYGITTYVYAGASGNPAAGPVTLPVRQGICVARLFAGAVTLSATVSSILNTQPTVSSGPVTLGFYGYPTPTPASPTTETPTPTMIAVLTPTETAAPTPTETPIPTPTDTPTPTATTQIHTLSFALDAARVDRPESKGTKRGLDVLAGGAKVWLMMYYTIADEPGPIKRTTTYSLWDGSRLVYRASFSGTDSGIGGSVRYLPIQLPTALSPGIYEFRATLRLGHDVADRAWHFAVVSVPGIAS